MQDLFYIWKQEFRTTFRDQGVLIFFILVPLAYPLIYGFIYTNETLRDVPAVVVDDSRSSLSRKYVRMLDASPEVAVVAHCADMEEAKLAMRERNAYGIVYLPETFSDDIAAGRQTQVSLFCDMSGLMYYKALLSANTEVSLEMNAEIKTARAGNTTERQDQITVYPIEYKDIALYNPTNGFAAFLLPAVLMLVIQQTLLLGIGLSAGRSHSDGALVSGGSLHQKSGGTGVEAQGVLDHIGKLLHFLTPRFRIRASGFPECVREPWKARYSPFQ